MAAGLGRVHLQAEQEGRWHRQAGVAGGAGGVVVGVDRVGLAGGLGKERSRPRSTSTVNGGIAVADVAAVDHAAAFCASCLVERDDAGAAQPQVVLQRQARAFHLALLGLAAQLPGQLGTLRQAGGAQRVALGQQAARRVGDHPPP
jgi:hypothetical protein